MIRRLTMLVALAAATMGMAPQPRDTLDTIAREYVQLSLEAGVREEGYVDAYYGPAEWQSKAKANPRTVQQLSTDAAALVERTRAIDPARLSPIERKRRAFLMGQLTAASTRMAMAGGKKFSFDDEARGLFGVTPKLASFAELDAALAELDRLAPGKGTLAERVAAMGSGRGGGVIPPDRIAKVVGLAIAECKARTLKHIPLPAGESFTLGLAKDKPWGAYNYYKGNFTSHIDVNTDQPVEVAAAVVYGCHEGYPGHHVYNMLLERDLLKGRGWVEFSIYPLYGPQSLIAEGSGNYGVEIAFPGQERARFEAATLYPAAGVRPPSQAADARIAALRDQLGRARFTIAREYLDGRIDRAEAIALTQKYALVGPDAAAKSLSFTDAYRSYVINYGYGLELVRAAVEASAPDQDGRWRTLKTILSEPTTPADLIAMAGAGSAK